MEIEEIKREVDLIEYARNKHGYKCNSSGNGHCPFSWHEDKNSSFSIFKDNGGIWRFKCFAENISGTIVDLVMKMENKNVEEAMESLRNEFSSGKNPGDRTPKPAKNKVIREHIYKDRNEKEIHKKVKYESGDYSFFHFDGNKWKPKKGNHEPIPYRLEEFNGNKKAIICEGEKDVETIEALDLDLLATTAPYGMSNWPESITKYFEQFEEVTFIYDVGNESYAKEHATKLQEAFPDMSIFIGKVPMEEREKDITDFLEQYPDEKSKQKAFKDILQKKEKSIPNTAIEEQNDGNFVGTLEELMEKKIPEEEKLIDPILFKGGLTEIGGVKGSHKSFFVISLSLHLASGKSPFLRFSIEKPRRVLLIQQEVSLGYMQKRLKKMIENGQFNTEKRFFPTTTTSKQLKLQDDKDLDQIKKWIDEYKPDVLCLDPLSIFNTSEENVSKDMSKIVKTLTELKSQYNIAIVITHHFSSKVNPNNPNAPIEAGGWFRGHSILTDAADCLICLHRLAGQQNNPNLPKDFQDYNQVEVSLRNEKNPKNFAIEFDEETFLLNESNILQEIGKKIFPIQIKELLESNENQMLQKDVIGYFKDIASPSTVKRAIDEGNQQGLFVKDPLSQKGNPILIKIRQ